MSHQLFLSRVSCATFLVLGICCFTLLGCGDGEGDQSDYEALLQNRRTDFPMKKGGHDPNVTSESFGKTAAGDEVTHFTCTNVNGLSFSMIDYGATLTAVNLPDGDGKFDNVVLSCPDIESYEKCTSYFGSTVGRYCNRIANGKFSIAGTEYTLATNNGNHHLHGGESGFDKKMWSASEIKTDETVGVEFKYTSPDGEEGYPGTLKVTAKYTLDSDNRFKIEFDATTDKATIVNITNHAYWNFAGKGDILDHFVALDANGVLVVDDELIPTGANIDNEGETFEMVGQMTVGEYMAKVKEGPLPDFDGYDFCYTVELERGKAPVGSVVDEKSTRGMSIDTNQPSVQFYTGNHLDGSEGSGGYGKHAGLCLETQFYPDSPNHEADFFPSTVLQPGRRYHSETTILFYNDF